MFSGRSWAALAAVACVALSLWVPRVRAQSAQGPVKIADADAALAQARGHNALPSDADGLPRIEHTSVSQRAIRVLMAATLPNHPIRPDDVTWLTAQQLDNGGWGFGEGHTHTDQVPTWTDIINTHLAVAALADAAAAGHDVPDETFTHAVDYCLAAQNDDGGWGYTPPAAEPLRVRPTSHGSATAAALAALVDAARAESDQGEQREGAIVKGTIWLTNHFAGASDPEWKWGRQRHVLHYLYALQRFANRRGIRTLTGRSLRHEIAEALIASQHAEGIWTATGNDLIDTASAILTLTETRRPILISAMNLTDRADTEVANWIDHCRKIFGRPYGWQAVDPKGDPSAVADASILYIQIDNQFALPGNWAPALRTFVESGGTVVVATNTDMSADLAQITQTLATTLGPWPVLTDITDHVVLTAKFPLKVSDADGARVVGNRLRPAGVVLPRSVVDKLIGGRDRQSAREAFELATNVTIAATGSNPPMGRSPLAAPGESRFSTFQSIRVARAMHDGDWYVAPRAMAALNDALAAALSLGVDEVDPVALKDPPPKKTLLWLAITDRASFNAFERQTLRSWLRNGGTVFIDCAAGSDDGLKAARTLVEKMLDEGALVPLPLDHPLITGEFGGGIGCDLRHVDYTPAVTQPPVGVSLLGATIDGRLAVIVSPYGVTPAIANLPAVNAKTLSTADARRVGINLLLWSVSGR